MDLRLNPKPGAPTRLIALACVLLLLAAVAAQALKPSQQVRSHPPGLIERGLPQQLGPWAQTASLNTPVDLTIDGNDGERSVDHPYDEVVMRSYTDPAGRELVLAIAYSLEQKQWGMIHLPDLCYPSQGWKILSWQTTPLSDLVPGLPSLQGAWMLTQKAAEREAVLYFVRTGKHFASKPSGRRWAMLASGLEGDVPDGALIRVSMRVGTGDELGAVRRQLENFLAALLGSSSPEAVKRLLSSPA